MGGRGLHTGDEGPMPTTSAPPAMGSISLLFGPWFAFRKQTGDPRSSDYRDIWGVMPTLSQVRKLSLRSS